MIRIIYSTFVCLFILICPSLNGQKSNYGIGFSEASYEFQYYHNQCVFAIEVEGESSYLKKVKDFNVSVKVDHAKSTIPSQYYKVITQPYKLSEYEGNKRKKIFIEIKDDIPFFDSLKLNLVISVEDKKKKDVSANNKSKTKNADITIKNFFIQPNSDYNYLAYVGTNFDLVDGLKPKNLFFATNIFLPPLPNHSKVGYYLSLYGNRASSVVDSSTNIFRTTKIIPNSDSTSIYVKENLNIVQTTTSDNLGAYCNLLVNLWGFGSLKKRNQLYWSPSLEFIWRRVNSVQSFNRTGMPDSTTIRPTIISRAINLIQEENSIEYNEFLFKAGLVNLFFTHENKRISVRVHGCLGFSNIYSPTQISSSALSLTSYIDTPDIFFTGRAWITDAKSGITLQAEVTNFARNTRPFYGVTLSKAIGFKDLGGFFSPISKSK